MGLVIWKQGTRNEIKLYQCITWNCNNQSYFSQHYTNFKPLQISNLSIIIPEVQLLYQCCSQATHKSISVMVVLFYGCQPKSEEAEICFAFINHQWSWTLRIESGGSSTIPLDIRSSFRNKTITVISSWKWRRTFLSILRRSEYLISRFLAASCRAALTSLLALPCIQEANEHNRIQDKHNYPNNLIWHTEINISKWVKLNQTFLL